MSIEGKHAYRFGYLKSEQWSNVRLEALAREKAKCQVCGEESISNDAHHIWYPENIYETRSEHLVILCRPCHDFIHTMIPECKTSDEDEGKEHWKKFFNAIKSWRIDKIEIFKYGEDLKMPARDLREAYCKVRDKAREQGNIIAAYEIQYGLIDLSKVKDTRTEDRKRREEERRKEHLSRINANENAVISIIKNWAHAYREKMSAVDNLEKET